jgi:hypothetical protein
MQFPKVLQSDPVAAGGCPYGPLLTVSPDKPVFSKIDSFESYLEEMEQLKPTPKSLFLLPVSSEVDLSEVVPHGSTLFQIRFTSFLPK